MCDDGQVEVWIGGAKKLGPGDRFTPQQAVVAHIAPDPLPCLQRNAPSSSPSMSKPTADWERVGDRFYRKTQLYTSVFDADLELENYIVTGAPYSGAVGMHAH